MSTTVRKIVFTLVIFLIAVSYIIPFTYATEIASVESTLSTFISYLNTGNENIYSIIDTSNYELNQNIEKYLHSIDIQYSINEVSQLANGNYNIKAKIAASGIGWNISGFSANFEFSQNNNSYQLVNTDLFNIVGSDNVFSFVIKMFVIIGIFILAIVIIIVIIVILVVKKSLKKKADNDNNPISNS